MKRRFAVCVAILLFGGSFFRAGAASLAEQNRDTGEIRISGKAEEYAGKNVTLVLLREGKDFSDIVEGDAASALAVLAYFGKSEIAEDGSYEFKFFVEGDSGIYGYRLSFAGESAEDGEVDIFSTTESDAALTAVNAAIESASATAMTAAITEYRVILSIADIMDRVTDKNAVGANLLKENAFGSVSEITEKARLACVVALFNEASSAQDMGALIGEFSELLGLDSSAFYKDYKSDAVKARVNAGMLEPNFVDPEDVLNKFTDIGVMSLINAVLVKTEIVEVIKKYNDVFEIDLAEYESHKTKIDTYLASCSMSNPAEVKSAYLDALAKAKTPVSAGIGGGGGGGGGGSVRTIGADAELLTPKLPAAPVIDVAFEDLGGAEWAREAVITLAEKKIVSGRDGKLFAPNDSIKREEFVKMVVLAAGIHDPDARISFTDVSEGDWFCSYVASAVERGLINGMGDGSFGAGSLITRQDMAVICHRALKTAPGTSAPIDFVDAAEISGYSKEAVAALCGMKIMNGVGDNRFAPAAPATRAMAAKVIFGLMMLEGGIAE